jgi:hypothetical protein
MTFHQRFYKDQSFITINNSTPYLRTSVHTICLNKWIQFEGNTAVCHFYNRNK